MSETDAWTDHECEFPEVQIEPGDFDPGDMLQPGMKVLLPCPRCGETPLDELNLIQAEWTKASQALLQVKPELPLYHWSPVARRKQILRYGLRPWMRTTTNTTPKTPVICFADTPSWAWALSGNMRWTPPGTWDLWQTYASSLTEPVVLAAEDRASGLYEVRTEHRVYKRDLWYIGSREKAPER